MEVGLSPRPDTLWCWRQTGTVFLSLSHSHSHSHTHTHTHTGRRWKLSKGPGRYLSRCWSTAGRRVFRLHMFRYKLGAEHKSRFLGAHLSKPQISNLGELPTTGWTTFADVQKNNLLLTAYVGNWLFQLQMNWNDLLPISWHEKKFLLQSHFIIETFLCLCPLCCVFLPFCYNSWFFAYKVTIITVVISPFQTFLNAFLFSIYHLPNKWNEIAPLTWVSQSCQRSNRYWTQSGIFSDCLTKRTRYFRAPLLIFCTDDTSWRVWSPTDSHSTSKCWRRFKHPSFIFFWEICTMAAALLPFYTLSDKIERLEN